jgi:hypothetical protein
MLAEFRVLTSNTTAEYGRNSGGQVAMVTKSGTNELHGAGFWFYRTPRFNANEWQNNLLDIGKRQFVQHIFGGSLGGPIIKDKTFFFANVQLLRALDTVARDRTVLTGQARRGILRYVAGGRNRPSGLADSSVDAAGNVRPGIAVAEYNVVQNDPERLGLDPTIQALIGRTPLPNNFAGGDGLNTAFYTFTAAQKERQRDFVFKIDHILNASNTVFARVAWGRQDTNCDTANGGEERFPGTGCLVNTLRNPRNLAFNWRSSFTPHITNELVVGHNQFTFDFPTSGQDPQKVSIVAPLSLTMPEAYDYGNLRALRTLQFVDNLAWFRGSHAIKFGTNVRYQQHQDIRGSVAGYNITQDADFSSAIATVDPATFGLPAALNVQFDRPTFQSAINFLLGRVGGTRRGFSSDGDTYLAEPYEFDARFPEIDFYAQDTWKARRNLTVDLGLRWEMKLTPREANGKIRRPDQLMTYGAAPTNTVRWIPGELFPNDIGNLAPSIGMAWDPTGSGKTAVRANYRLAYDRLNTFILSSAVFQNLPGTTLGVSNTEFGQSGGRLRNLPTLSPPNVRPSDLAQPGPFSTGLITVVDPDFRSPTTHQWAFGVQREILSRTVLDVSYIGRRAYNLYGAYNANAVDIFRSGFLEGFKAIKAGGDSPLINSIFAADSRRNANETASQMIRRLYAGDLSQNNVASVANSLATRLQGGRSVTDLSGAGPYALLSFPQFGGGVRVIDSNDFSTYHGLFVQVERRFSAGVGFQASYSFSKSLDTRSYDPAFTVYGTGSAQSAAAHPFDLNNRKLNYARSEFDRTHVVQANWVVELPFGRGKPFGQDAGGVLDRVIGGWEFSGYLRLMSGRPMTIFSGANTVSSVVQTPANCGGCSKDLGEVFEDPVSGFVFYLNPEEIARFSIPGPGEWSDTGRNYFTGPGTFNMDAALLKRIRVNERWNVELRADALNVTNTPTFGFPTLTYTSSTFGRIRSTIDSASRKVQLGAKINF